MSKWAKYKHTLKCVVCINLRGNSVSFWTTIFGREHNQWLFLCFFLKLYLSQIIYFTAHNYHKTMTGFHLSHLFQSLAWRVGAWVTCALIIIRILHRQRSACVLTSLGVMLYLSQLSRKWHHESNSITNWEEGLSQRGDTHASFADLDRCWPQFIKSLSWQTSWINKAQDRHQRGIMQ